LEDVPLRGAKGDVVFVLGQGIVERIVVKVPGPIHPQVIADLVTRFGEPKRSSAAAGSDGAVSLLWRVGFDRVTASDRPGKRGFGVYVISR
jgi:hypothetical protein